jgi:low affinity Fe/Cu permease
MVFLIQNTQNRDSVAIQLKLDELIRGVEGARTSLVDLENLDDEDILRLKKESERIHRGATTQDEEASRARLADTESPATST